MIEWMINNKEWFFSGIGVVVLGWIVNFIFARNRDTSKNNQKVNGIFFRDTKIEQNIGNDKK